MEGIEKGEICNRNSCKGIIDEHEKETGCSCHINAPCGSCERDYSFCPECDWNAEDERTSYHISDKDRKYYIEQNRKFQEARDKFYNLYHSSELVSEFNYRSESHSNSSMKKIGYFPIGTSRVEIIAKVRGTFGGRFNRFNEEIGRFEYIAYTD